MSDVLPTGKWIMFDKIINVHLIRVETDPNKVADDPTGYYSAPSIDIVCPDGGLKPAISLSCKMLPNNICYQVTVKITNFSLRGTANIRDLNVMQVDVGYRKGETVQLTGPIFSSYQESPSPGGITVFEGVVVGTVGPSLLKDQPFRIEFNQDKVTIGYLFKSVVFALNLVPNVDYVKPELLDIELNVQKNICRAGNGLAVLNWLNTTIEKYSETWFGAELGETNPVGLFIIWDQETVILCQKGVESPQLQNKDREAAIELDMIKTASFSGPVLKASSLFNPKVKPGRIIHMDPVYFTGGTSLGNMITEATFNPDKGYYRVITMSMEFDTNGSTNDMTITAVPLSNNPVNTDKAAEDAKQLVEARIESAKAVFAKREEMIIKFGEPQPEKAEDVPPKDLWSVNYAPSENAIKYTIQPGDVLSIVAQNTWGSGLFKLDASEMNVPEGETFVPDSPRGVPLYYFFPLIMIDTYRNMEANKNAPSNPFYIDISNPDRVRVDKQISIPALDESIIRSHVGDSIWIQIFDMAEQYYRGIEKYEWAKKLHDIYAYLKWGKK